MGRYRVLGWVCTCGLLVGLASVAVAEELPSATEIIDRYAEVTGGKAAYEAIDNRVSTGRGEMMGQALSFEQYQSRPNQLRMRMESNGTLVMEQGFDGKVGWANIPSAGGPLIVEGASLQQLRQSASLDPHVSWASTATGVVEKSTVDEQPCYRLYLEMEELGKMVLDFDVETGLLRQTNMSFRTPGTSQTMELTLRHDDWRAVDGILLSHTTEIVGLGQSLQIQEIKHNVDLAEGAFSPPPEVQALIKKSAGP